MFNHWELMIAALALTLAGQVHTGRIIDGQPVEPHSRRYMVLIRRQLEGQVNHCGGFLLNKDYVMTAAHCKAPSYRVFLGLHDYSKNAQSVSVEQDFPHDPYTRKYLENDIMLLKLSSKVDFNGEVGPIDLAGPVDSPPTSCSVSGWGQYISNHVNMSHTLREADVTLFDDDRYPVGKLYLSQGEAGPGLGDSGGPLVCNGKAYGVISVSMPINSTQGLYVYTKIPAYTDWIASIMSKS